MNNSVCTLNVDNSTCFNCCSNICEDPLQDSLDAPMPLIGIYIAAASAVSLLANAIYGFRRKYFWFPCKFFSLNSISLTLLAVAMKLSVDLTGKMIGPSDKLARVTSLVFMSTAMANFMTSLGSMENNEILSNMAALVILVVTIAINICIRNVQMSSFDDGQEMFVEEIVCTVFMILLLVILCSVSIVVPAAKTDLESIYYERHEKLVSNKQVEWGNFNTDELRRVVTRYWVMAQTGNAQFVIARSAICVIPGILCLLMAPLTLYRVSSQVPSASQYVNLGSSSDYKSSVFYIVMIQSIFVSLATIAPVFRWFTAAQLHSRQLGHISSSITIILKESYWIESLQHWRFDPIPSIIQRYDRKKLVYRIKILLLVFCGVVQIVIVVISKLLLLISATCAKLFSLCSYCSEVSTDAREQDVRGYVVQLPGEAELSDKTLKNLCKQVDYLIELGKKKQPQDQDLIKLLEKSVNFNGVRDFGSRQIQSLYSDQELPDLWSFPIVILASIAIALPDIPANMYDQLLRGVKEGLNFVKPIEKTFHTNGELHYIKKQIYRRGSQLGQGREWPFVDTQEIRRESQNYKDALQKLSNLAKEQVTRYESTYPDISTRKEDLYGWCRSFVIPKAMDQISETIIILSNTNNSVQTGEQLFERLSIMISDILSACLTNLPHAITLKCHNTALNCHNTALNRHTVVKEREKAISKAGLLLGKSEEILQTLKHRVLPKLDKEKAPFIDEWSKFMEQDSENPVASDPAETKSIPKADREHVIEVED